MFEKLLKWLRGQLHTLFDNTAESDILYSSQMENALPLWVQIYEGGGPWCNQRTGLHSLGIGAAVAQELARLAVSESSISLTGSARADWLQQQAAPFLAGLQSHTELACALGGVVFKPYVTAEGVAVDVVQADCFFPTTFDTSRRMTGAVFSAQLKRGNTIYTRLEHHEYADGAETIQNRAFASASCQTLGHEIPLTEVPEWADILPQARFENISRPLFGYFRMPGANRIDRHSPLGASCYALAVDCIRDADVQYGSLLWEYRGGELALDVDATAIRQNPDGALELSAREKRLFRHVANSRQDLFSVFAPALRDESYRKGLDAILKRIEFQCGLAYGALSDPQSVEKTAEEVRSSKQRSYSTVRLIQAALQSALDDLFSAMDAYASAYHLAPAGSYALACDWGDSILNDPAARKAQFWQYVEAGRYPFARYLVEFEGYTPDEAAAACAEAESGTALFFGTGG